MGTTVSSTRILLAAWPLGAVFLLASSAAAFSSGDVTQYSQRALQGNQLSANQPDSLRLWLELPDLVRVDEAVPITLQVENIGDRPLDLSLRGRAITFDLLISHENGAQVWRRLEDAVIPAILRLETLEPGGTLVLRESWDQRSDAGDPVPAGVYTVTGELLTDGQPLSTPAEPLRIGPDE